jgi:hypothetical protein
VDWISTLLWDVGQYAFLTGLVMLVFHLYGGGATRTYLHTRSTTLATFTLLFMYGLASLPLAYLYSWGFENPSTAQISIAGINFVTGGSGSLLVRSRPQPPRLSI